MPINPSPISGDFNEAAYQFLLKEEDFAIQIYTDTKGIPTLGAGYALAIEDPVTGRLALRSTVVGDLQSIGITLNQADFQRLQDTVNAVNLGNLKLAETLIPPYKFGQE